MGRKVYLVFVCGLGSAEGGVREEEEEEVNI